MLGAAAVLAAARRVLALGLASFPIVLFLVKFVLGVGYAQKNSNLQTGKLEAGSEIQRLHFYCAIMRRGQGLFVFLCSSSASAARRKIPTCINYRGMKNKKLAMKLNLCPFTAQQCARVEEGRVGRGDICA